MRGLVVCAVREEEIPRLQKGSKTMHTSIKFRLIMGGFPEFCHVLRNDKELAANYADYANGRIKRILDAPIRVIRVIRG